MRQFLIHNKLVVAAREAISSMDACTSDSSREFSGNNSSDGKNTGSEFECDLWSNISEQMDDENVSGVPRTNKVLAIILYFMKCIIDRHRDRTYRVIMGTLRKEQVSKHFCKPTYYCIYCFSVA